MSDPFSKHAVNEGRKLLRKLLPQAYQMARTGRVGVLRPQTDIGVRIQSYMVLSNCDSLVLRQLGRGGWVADILLKVGMANGTPEGDEGNIIGTPNHEAFASRAEAEVAGFGLLVAVIENERLAA